MDEKSRAITFDEWLELKLPRLKEMYEKEVPPVWLCARCGRRFWKTGRQEYCTRKCSDHMRAARFKERHAE